jgi:hypothetical protein
MTASNLCAVPPKSLDAYHKGLDGLLGRELAHPATIATDHSDWFAGRWIAVVSFRGVDSRQNQGDAIRAQ